MMKTFKHKILKSLLLSTALILSTPLLASDSGTDIEQNDNDRSSGYLKIGYGYKYEQSPYHQEQNGGSLFLSGRYQFDFGLYIEASHGANELSVGNGAGFNFYNTEHWNFDIHYSQAHGSTEMGFGFLDENNEDGDIIILRMDRDSTQMLGLRATGTYGQTTFQVLASPYSFNDEYDDGLFVSAWLAHTWQVKNWELYASAGVNYRSEEIINYYYSTSDEVVAMNNPKLSAYNGDGGFDVIGQVGVSYPMTKDILFESYFRYTDVADSISDSPVMKGFATLNGRSENITEFGILFNYVF